MIYNYDLNKDEIYNNLILLLQEIKLSTGGDGVKFCLIKHKKLKDFIINYQKNQLDFYEKSIDKLSKEH